MSSVAYLVRHGEVEHHRTDVSLTPRGREQAEAAGAVLAARLAASPRLGLSGVSGAGNIVSIQHSPVRRVVETAELLRASLSSALTTAGYAGRIAVSPPQPDEALCNVRFILEPGREPEEPSLLHTQINTPAYLQAAPPARVEFYRGFWSSNDPMGYWLTHDSAGAAETPAVVLNRLLTRLKNLFAAPARTKRGPTPLANLHWIGVTHSGAMRVLLRQAFGEDPGEPNFCEVIGIEPAAASNPRLGPRLGLSGVSGAVTLSYRGQSALLPIAESR